MIITMMMMKKIMMMIMIMKMMIMMKQNNSKSNNRIATKEFKHFDFLYGAFFSADPTNHCERSIPRQGLGSCTARRLLSL